VPSAMHQLLPPPPRARASGLILGKPGDIPLSASPWLHAWRVIRAPEGRAVVGEQLFVCPHVIHRNQHLLYKIT